MINNGTPFDRHMAWDLGFAERDLREMLRIGQLRVLFRGVYVDVRAPDSRAQRLAGIRLIAPPEAIVCNESAAWLYRVDTFKPSEQHLLEPSMVVPHGSTRATVPGVRCRQAIIKARDITSIGGVLVTNPVRTTSDLLRRLYRPYALAAADGLARAGLISPEEVIEFVAKLKGYPGIVQARSLSLLFDPRAESPGESWQRLRMIDAGFPIPEPQFVVVDRWGRERRLDLAYPIIKVGAEYDGREFHTEDVDVDHDDDRRDYLSTILGWRIVPARREGIFGEDTSFEDELGHHLGMTPRPRFWGTSTLATPKISLAA